MSAAALRSDDASAARTDAPPSAIREGRVIQVVYLRGSGAVCSSDTMFGPTPYEAAKKVCEGLMLDPELIEVQDFPEARYAVLKSRRTHAYVGVIDAKPHSERLGYAIAEALGRLEAERWRPIRDWRELMPS